MIRRTLVIVKRDNFFRHGPVNRLTWREERGLSPSQLLTESAKGEITREADWIMPPKINVNNSLISLVQNRFKFACVGRANAYGFIQGATAYANPPNFHKNLLFEAKLS